MAITFPTSPTIVYGTTSFTFTYPAMSAGDALFLVIGQKPSTANSGGVTVPSGFTLQASHTGQGGYGATIGVDTGNTNLFILSKDDVTGAESGNLTVNMTTSDVVWCCPVHVASDGNGYDIVMVLGSDSTAGNVSIAFGADPDVKAGDAIVAAMCIPTDVTTPAQFSAHAISHPGVTYGSITEIGEPDTANGNDLGGYLIRAIASSGQSTNVPTITATATGTTTNVRGPGIFLRIREFLKGAGAATEAEDVVAGIASYIIGGSGAAGEAEDVVAGLASLTVSAVGAAIEAADGWAGGGYVEVIPPQRVAAPIADLAIADAILPPVEVVPDFTLLQRQAVINVVTLVVMTPFTQEVQS